MQIFAERPKDFMDRFSREFEAAFMDLVSRRWKTKRVAANVVYNEYISDRQHTHMNATIWSTLTEFVQYARDTSLLTRAIGGMAIGKSLNLAAR